MKKILSFILMSMVFVLTIACGEVKKIDIVGSDTAYVGDTRLYKALVLPDNVSQEVEWISSDTSIATINSGIASFLSVGKVSFSATSLVNERKSSKITVTVSEKGLSIGQDFVMIENSVKCVGVGEELELQGRYSKIALVEEYEWIVTNNTGKARIENNKLIGIEKGTVSVSLYVDGKYTSETFLVYDKDLEYIIIQTNRFHDNMVIELCVLQVDNEIIDNEFVSWSVSNNNIFINELGEINRNSIGEVNIIATIKGCDVSFSSLMIVDEILPKSIEIIGPTYVMLGVEYQYKANVFPSNASQEVEWVDYSNPKFSVSENGIFVGKEVGQVILTVCTVGWVAAWSFSGYYYVQQTLLINIVEPSSIDVDIIYEDSLLIGDSMQLEVSINPMKENYEISWSVSDELIASIDDNGVLSGLKAGIVKVFVSIDGNICGEVEIEILEYVETLDFSIIDDLSYMLPGMSLVLREILIERNPINASKTYDKLYFELDKSSVEYALITQTGNNYRLSINITTPIGTNIGVWFLIGKLDGTLIKKLVVVSVDYVIDYTSYVEDITLKINDKFMFTATKQRFYVQIYPQDARLDFLITSSDPSVVKVEGLLLIALKPGEVIISVTCADVTLGIKKDDFVLVVLEEVNYEPRVDLGSYLIVSAEASTNLHNFDPYHVDYKKSDRLALISAYESTKALYNCNFSWVEYKSAYGSSRVSEAINNVKSNNSYYDFGLFPTEFFEQLINNDVIVELTDYYNTYGYKQMSEDQILETTYQNILYGVHNVSAVANVLVNLGIVYNVNLLRIRGIESPAKLFNEDKWSVSDFISWVKQAQSMLEDDEYVICGKPYLWWQGIINAANLAVFDAQNGTINILPENDDEDFYPKYVALKLRELYKNEYWSHSNGWDNGCIDFNEGRALTQSAYYWFINDSGRFYDTMWGDDTSYGWSPFPYLDSNNDISNKYLTKQTKFMGVSLLMVNGRMYPDGISSANIYQAWAEMVYTANKNIKEDINYDYYKDLYNQISLKITDEDTKQAIMYFNSEDKLIYDPVRIIVDGSDIGIKLGILIDTIVFNDYDYETIGLYLEANDYIKFIKQYGK